MFGIPDMLGMVVPPAAASPPVVETAEVAAGAAAAEPPDPPPQAASTGSVSETAAAASRQPCPRELEEHRIVYSPFRSVVTDLCPGSTFSARGPRLWSRLWIARGVTRPGRSRWFRIGPCGARPGVLGVHMEVAEER